jgi:hypothetical protein
MEEGIERKLGPSFEVISLRAPRHFTRGYLTWGGVRIQTDAGGRLLIKSLHEAVKALFAHY